ncbi:hypothetical protein GCM10027612_01400 [Microbispora bryophytorum subsp. camponoti]
MRPSLSLFKLRSLGLLAMAAAVGLTSVVVTGPVNAASPASAHSVKEQMPAGFSEHKVQAGSVGINYVIGGHGPTLVLIHGYPQTWYEWRHIMPALAEHYTVIAPDLPGAGRSDAPAAGYDKKTMAAELHALLVRLGRDKDLRIVGHDIGTMVAYSYAAAHPADVRKLVLSEAPIPDPGIYSYPSLTADGPGPWHFGFFALANGLPEDLVSGRETLWTGKFIEDLEVKRGPSPRTRFRSSPATCGTGRTSRRASRGSVRCRRTWRTTPSTASTSSPCPCSRSALPGASAPPCLTR